MADTIDLAQQREQEDRERYINKSRKYKFKFLSCFLHLN